MNNLLNANAPTIVFTTSLLFVHFYALDKYEELETMGLAQSNNAPYAPVDAVAAVIDTYRERTLQEPVTVDVLVKCGVSQSLAPRTVKSLKLLDLLGPDGYITSTFEKFKHASTDQYQDVLADWLRDVYKPVFDYVDPTADPQRIIDQFRSYEPSGQRNRMVSLFLGLCVKAGLLDKEPPMPRRTSPNLSHAKRATIPRPPAMNKMQTPPRPEPSSDRPHKSEDDTYHVTLRSGGKVALTVAVDVFKLDKHDRTFVFDLVDKIRSYSTEEGTDP